MRHRCEQAFGTVVARVLAAGLGAWLALSSPMAQAQEPQDCNQALQQCVSGCNFIGSLNAALGNACRSGCQSTRQSCGATPAQVPAQRPAPGVFPRPGFPQVPGVPAQRPVPPVVAPAPRPAPEPVVASAPVVLQPYEGPSRYFHPDASTGGRDAAANDAVPLATEHPQDLKNGALLTRYSWFPETRNDAERATLRALDAEYGALNAAGHKGLNCTYGPLRDGTWASLGFWHKQRTTLSPLMLAEVKRRNGPAFDTALEQCPRTWGEALAIGSGRKAAPTTTDIAAGKAQIAANTGMRFVPTIPGLGAFDDVRQLTDTVVLNALNIRSTHNGTAMRAAVEGSPAGVVRDTLLRLDDAGQKVLLCYYAHEGRWSEDYGDASVAAFSPAFAGRSVSAQYTLLRFWHNTKPANVSAEFLEQIGKSESQGANQHVLVDMAVPSCPVTYGGAMAVVDGSPQALATAKKVASSIAGLDASVTQSDSEDMALLRDIHRSIASLEASAGGMTPEAFERAVSGTLKTSFSRVGSSVLNKLQDIPVAPGSRKRFDAWDRNFGGPLLDAIRRLYVVAQKKAFRLETSGASLSDLTKTGDQMKQERTAWINAARAQLYTRPIYKALVTGYDRHLADQPMLDAAVLARARKEASIVGPTPRPQPVTRTVETTEVIVFGTPGEIAAARVGLEIGSGIGGAVAAAGQVQATHRQLSDQIAQARTGFWQCYEARCGDLGRRFADYSLALRDKDFHYLFQTVFYAKGDAEMRTRGDDPRMLTTLLQYLGAGSVDDGIALGCESRAEAFKGAFTREVAGTSAFDAGALLGKYMEMTGKPDYLAYQACRDRSEYMMRTRSR